MKGHINRLVKLSESVTPVLLDMQEMNTESEYYGNFIMKEKGFAEVAALHIPIANYVAMYYHKASPYYMDEKLLDRALLSLETLIAATHEDGTMDLYETNFHDATCIGFTVTPLAYVFRVLKREDRGSKIEQILKDRLRDFFRIGAQGMCNGGFHTPNHRWVMAAALSLMSNILDNNRYREEAERYLAEGIDCDSEGNYTERSVAIYDITVNESLIVIARELEMPELYEHIQRNLKKNFTYFEPDGTICTLNSRRQDNSTKYYPLRHYWTYLYMAHITEESLYADTAEWLLSSMEKMAYMLPDLMFTGGKEDIHTPLIQYLLSDGLENEFEIKVPAWDGEWYYPNNGVVRKRSGKKSLTLLRDRPVFFKYQNGNNSLTLRIASCFFGNGYFIPESIEVIEGGYRLSSRIESGYKRPLSEEVLKETAGEMDWFKLPHEKRESVWIQVQNTVVDILVKEDEVKLKIKMDGTDHVPMKIECMFSPGGMFSSDQVLIRGDGGGSLIMKAGNADYGWQGNIINISGGAYSHWYTGNMRGTEKTSPEHFTVYMTGRTPFEHTLTLT